MASMASTTRALLQDREQAEAELREARARIAKLEALEQANAEGEQRAEEQRRMEEKRLEARKARKREEHLRAIQTRSWVQAERDRRDRQDRQAAPQRRRQVLTSASEPESEHDSKPVAPPRVHRADKENVGVAGHRRDPCPAQQPSARCP